MIFSKIRAANASQVLCWIAGAALFSACQRSSPVAEKRAEKPREFRAAKVRLEPADRTVRSFGSLAAQDQAVLSAKASGRLEKMAVDLGSAVRKGDLIAQIDPRDYQLRLEQAEAQLAQARLRLGLPARGGEDTIALDETSAVRQARAVLDEAEATQKRVRSLAGQKILSKSEVEAAEAAFMVAQSRHQDAMEAARAQQALVAQRRAEWRIARQQLEDTAIRAPFDGAVQERRANLGEYLPESAPVVTLVRTDPLRLRLEVVEREAPRIAIGQQVRLTLQGSTNVFTGEIKRVSPALDEKSRMLRVEADVPNADGALRPGSFVTADIVVARGDLITVIPEEAVVTFAGIERVFVIEGGKAVERSVLTGRRSAAGMEVTSGVKPGEVLLLSPGNLPNGSAVSFTLEKEFAPPPAVLSRMGGTNG